VKVNLGVGAYRTEVRCFGGISIDFLLLRILDWIGGGFDFDFVV
jgi:hypothetical protein